MSKSDGFVFGSICGYIFGLSPALWLYLAEQHDKTEFWERAQTVHGWFFVIGCVLAVLIIGGLVGSSLFGPPRQHQPAPTPEPAIEPAEMEQL